MYNYLDLATSNNLFNNKHCLDILWCNNLTSYFMCFGTEVQVGKDQEKAQSEKDSHSKNRGGKKTKLTVRYLYHETYRKPNEQLFSQ